MARVLVRLLVLTVAALTTLGVVSPASAATSPYCGITWGSLPKVASSADTETVDGVRSGRHDCFDRLVVDLGGQDTSFGSYDVRYVPVIREDGSGRPIPVRGGAFLQIVLRASAYDQDGNATFQPADPREVVNVFGYSTFRQVVWADTFEGYTTMGLGVRARLPFRVFVLPGTTQSAPTSRLVIDVAHRW
jgi:hypothetical protein